MDPLANIKNRIGTHFLKRLLARKNRRAKLRNMSEVKKVGLIFQVTEGMVDVIDRYVDYLKGEHGIRQVKVLGYWDGKELPADLLTHSAYVVVTKKELNWYRKPTAPEVLDFEREAFDVLVDFTRESCLPLDFVLAASDAALKVGRREEGRERFHDLMLDLEDDVDQEKFIEYLDHYLTSINKKETV